MALVNLYNVLLPLSPLYLSFPPSPFLETQPGFITGTNSGVEPAVETDFGCLPFHPEGHEQYHVIACSPPLLVTHTKGSASCPQYASALRLRQCVNVCVSPLGLDTHTHTCWLAVGWWKRSPVAPSCSSFIILGTEDNRKMCICTSRQWAVPDLTSTDLMTIFYKPIINNSHFVISLVAK